LGVVLQETEHGADYHRQASGHWIIDNPISNPMSIYDKYKKSRTSWVSAQPFQFDVPSLLSGYMFRGLMLLGRLLSNVNSKMELLVLVFQSEGSLHAS
jgi:hypothetical protein